MSSVFAHPWLGGLFADAEVAAIWAAEAQLGHMIAFEAAWSRHGHLAGLWSKADGTAAASVIEDAKIAPESLRDGTAKDGVCVPALVRLLKAEAGDAVHRGATSQDVIDTATALSMARTVHVVSDRLEALRAAIEKLQAEQGDTPMMARTRMQAALPIKAGHRIGTWCAGMGDLAEQVTLLKSKACRIQIGGPVGDRAALGDGAEAMVAAVAVELGLGADPCWHTQRGRVAEFAGALSMITGALGKMGQDLALMAQMGEVQIAGGGGSSAMPHKQNPVLAELLVTLARFNATQVSGVHHAMVHEQERSGAAWGLEWMILPQMAEAAGRALVVATELAGKIEQIGSQDPL